MHENGPKYSVCTIHISLHIYIGLIYLVNDWTFVVTTTYSDEFNALKSKENKKNMEYV